MAKSTRRPQRIYQAIMWLLSLVFAGFLIGLGSLIIKDLPQVDKSISLVQFADQDQLAGLDKLLSENRGNLNQLERQFEDMRAENRAASADYNSAKESLNSWLATRRATEASAQNPEVIQRTRALEQLRETERAALKKVETAKTALTAAERARTDMRLRRTQLINAGEAQYRRAQRGRELRVFIFRLILTLPLLLAAAWILMRRRESAYWPLYRGFVIFAFFAFFVELVPYLPSYGGYVRYSVGIIIALVAGHYIIAGMRRYMERKQNEEARSESVRRQSIEYETALKKIAAKTCPGCDRAIIKRDDVNTDFCVHCGIRLQQGCGKCGERNISFHKFCLCCGAPSATEELPA